MSILIDMVQAVPNPVKAGRNMPCPCGSGKKYKQCCMLNATIRNTSTDSSTQAMQAAWNFFRLGLLADAEATCQQVLQGKPELADALHLRGAIALQQGKTREAVIWINGALRYHTANPEYFNNLGLAYHEQGLLDDAVRQYQRAISIAPNYADAHYNLHAALLNGDDPAAAMKCLQRVLTINPQDMDARFMLGLLLDYAGSQAKAEVYFMAVRNASTLFAARYDAWQYLKNVMAETQQTHAEPAKRPRLIGSTAETFRLAINTANTTGLILEFGVRFGTSIRLIASLLSQHDGTEQTIHGFDSFEGLPEVWHHEPKGSYTTQGVMPDVPENIKLHAGWFDATLPSFLAEHSGNARLINIDCDIYSATKTVLELLAPRVVAGTIIVFDEYIGNAYWREDEFKAFQEAVKAYNWQYEYLCFSFFTKQLAVRITQTGN